MKYHPIANLFPLIEGDAFEQLKADIAAHGQREMIWTYKGEIIDGRNRHRACEALGIEPKFREWDGKGSLVKFTVSLNLHRRHLTSSQRATVAVEIEPILAKEKEKIQKEAAAKGGRESGAMRRGESKVVEIVPQPSIGEKARDEAAKITGTNGRYVSDAKKVKAESTDLFNKVKAGTMTLPQAVREVNEQKKAAEPPPRQVGPKLSAADEDSRKFCQLRDKLCDRWTTDYDKAAMKQCFRQLANEV